MPWKVAGRVSEQMATGDDVVRETGWVFNNATGELTYTPTIAEGGTAPTVGYQVCNTDPNPDVCATAIATLLLGSTIPTHPP